MRYTPDPGLAIQTQAERLEGTSPSGKCHVGFPVRVTSGAFAGVEGFVHRRLGGGHVVVRTGSREAWDQHDAAGYARVIGRNTGKVHLLHRHAHEPACRDRTILAKAGPANPEAPITCRRCLAMVRAGNHRQRARRRA